MSTQYTTAEVAKHKDEANGMWIIVDSGVYDITSAYLINVLPSHVRVSCWLTCTPRIHRRAPRRPQDPKEDGRQGLEQAVLEVPQRQGAGEVRAKVEDRRSQGVGQAMMGSKYPNAAYHFSASVDIDYLPRVPTQAAETMDCSTLDGFARL